MELGNKKSWPCVTCLARPLSFCSALLDASRGQPPACDNSVPQTFHTAGAHQNICSRGERAEDVYVLCHGWACNFIQLADGRRQIVSILLAGDFFSSEMVFEETRDLSTQALTEVRFCRMKRADVKAKVTAIPSALDALGNLCIVESKAKNELVANLGRRTAEERIAHLMLSLTRRINRLSVIREQRYPFPLRQQDIADATGLTPVHVSRVLTRFRDASLVELSGGHLTILNLAELERLGSLR